MIRLGLDISKFILWNNKSGPGESSVRRGFFICALRGRPMAGQQALDLYIEVRILAPQPSQRFELFRDERRKGLWGYNFRRSVSTSKSSIRSLMRTMSAGSNFWAARPVHGAFMTSGLCRQCWIVNIWYQWKNATESVKRVFSERKKWSRYLYLRLPKFDTQFLHDLLLLCRHLRGQKRGSAVGSETIAGRLIFSSISPYAHPNLSTFSSCDSGAIQICINCFFAKPSRLKNNNSIYSCTCSSFAQLALLLPYSWSNGISAAAHKVSSNKQICQLQKKEKGYEKESRFQ